MWVSIQYFGRKPIDFTADKRTDFTSIFYGGPDFFSAKIWGLDFFFSRNMGSEIFSQQILGV